MSNKLTRTAIFRVVWGNWNQWTPSWGCCAGQQTRCTCVMSDAFQPCRCQILHICHSFFLLVDSLGWIWVEISFLSSRYKSNQLFLHVALSVQLPKIKILLFNRLQLVWNGMYTLEDTEMTVSKRTSPPDLIKSTTCLWVDPSTLMLFLFETEKVSKVVLSVIELLVKTYTSRILSPFRIPALSAAPPFKTALTCCRGA